MSLSPTVDQKIRLLRTPFNSEALGVVQSIRGTGSLQAIEARTLPGQPGPGIRVAHLGQWESLSDQQGGEQ